MTEKCLNDCGKEVFSPDQFCSHECEDAYIEKSWINEKKEFPKPEWANPIKNKSRKLIKIGLILGGMLALITGIIMQFGGNIKP